MKANVKFWPESKSLDVSLYAETALELAQLRPLPGADIPSGGYQSPNEIVPLACHCPSLSLSRSRHRGQRRRAGHDLAGHPGERTLGGRASHWRVA